jgi:hypothetical protein
VPGVLKSLIPDGVEMPAPVITIIRLYLLFVNSFTSESIENDVCFCFIEEFVFNLASNRLFRFKIGGLVESMREDEVARELAAVVVVVVVAVDDRL